MKTSGTIKSNNGSVLIIVLWSLVLIGFLAGEYLDHNRGKACLAVNAWDSLKQKEAVDSVLNLFAADSWPIPGDNNRFGTWTAFSPGGFDLWVKVDSESNRININTASDGQMRNKMLELLGEDHFDKSNQLTDAILDWRDTDTLVRTNGAETDFYDSRGLPYKPANGPFKVLTELLLVKGVTSDVFWGDPRTGLVTEEEEEIEPLHFSLLDEFTIYSRNVKRVNIVVPGKQNGYTLITAFLEREKGRWKVLQLYRTMRVSAGRESQFLNRTEPGVES